MNEKRVSVWYDDTSLEHGWVVDVIEEDGSTMTVNILDDEDEAREWAQGYAEKSGLPLES